MRPVALSLMALCLPLAALAGKNDDGGVPLEIQVLDASSEAPIAVAKVRSVREKELHPVNSETGVWRGDVLYLPDGTEVLFEKGQQLTFEVSAVGYATEKIDYELRRRKNKVQVLLEKVEIPIPEDDTVIQFDRDEPIGGRPIPTD